MDPSALIFVGLAVAWAVYLIPKALEHHEEGARTRTVERFSATIRVLARREPVNRKQARLVPGAKPPSRDADVLSKDRRRRATKRRRRVLALVLLANVAVAALGWFEVVDWVWCAVPGGVLVAWLVACRLMVKRERRTVVMRRRIPAQVPAEPPQDATEEVARVDAPLLDERASRDPDSWDPVDVPLPTYVSKPVARRTVTTIDLDSTGVWSSGRSASDSALAREADAADRAGSSSEEERRATGA